MSDIEDLITRLAGLDPKDRDTLALQVRQATADMAWVPNPGPQTAAYFCDADELFYGGQAGGGKTDLLLGTALTAHQQSLILRRINLDVEKVGGLGPRLVGILGSQSGYNSNKHIYRNGEREIEFGGCEQESDKERYKGRPHDLIGYDEIADFLESQFRFINAWNRSANPNQRCRVIAAGNPPTRPEGLWVIKYWGPWLDPLHPNPARPGEIRWFTTINGVDTEVDGPGPHIIPGEKKPVRARSRSFIRAELADNPDYARGDYGAVLDALPEYLRVAYRDGNFGAGIQDADRQVIPTAWIVAAQERWKPDGWKEFHMTALAIDPAGGGADAAEIVARHGGWFAEPVTKTGIDTADGTVMAAEVFKVRRDACPVIVDVGGGYGGAVILRLKDNSTIAVRFDGGAKSTATTRDGSKLKFVNKRAEAWWRMREALNPEQEGGSFVALPPNAELRSDLAAPTWELTPRGILIESKDKLRERLGRSPGKGDATVMAQAEGDQAVKRQIMSAGNRGQRPTMANRGYAHLKTG